MAAFLFGLIEAIPAIRDVFFGVQDLYYNAMFERLSTDVNDYTGRRRAISNSIETAKTNSDLKHLSIMLAELQRSTGDRDSSGTTGDTESSPE